MIHRSVCLLFFVLILSACQSSRNIQTGAVAPGKYYNFYVAPEYAEFLLLRKDGLFRYELSYSSGQRFVDGQWKILNDSLIELSNYKKPNPLYSVKENQHAASDSVTLSFFMGEINGQRIKASDFLDITINNDCSRKYKPDADGKVILPKTLIKKISFSYVSYTVNNSSANEIIFSLNPVIYIVSPSDMMPDLWKVKGGNLFRIECGVPDSVVYFEWVKDDKELAVRLEKLKKKP